jgi:hypothetical protein
MSQQKIVRVIDSRVHLHEDAVPHKLILTGVERVNQQRIDTQSHSSTNTVFSFQPPNQHTVVDRKILLEMEVEVALDQELPLEPRFAPRQLPLHSAMSVITLSINGNSSMSTNPSDTLHYTFRYGNDSKERDREYSETAHMPDQFRSYAGWQQDYPRGGSGRNPLGGYGETYAEETRGSLNPVGVERDGVWYYRYKFTEALRVSPLVSQGEYEEGMTNINNMQVNIRWIPDLQYMFSGYLTNILNVNILVSDPKLYVNYITPSRDLNIPSEIVLPYERLNQFSKRLTVEALARSEYTSDNIRLSSIPRGFYLFGRHLRSDYNYENTNTCPLLSNVSIQWGNESNLLSNASEAQLHKIMVKNGYDRHFSQRGELGDVYYFEFGSDIGLEDDEAPESIGDYNLQVNCTVENPTGVQRTYDIMFVILQAGDIRISPNQAMITIGDITREDVKNAKEEPGVSQQDYEGMAKGGSFLGKHKRTIRKIAKTTADVAKAVSTIVPEAKLVEKGARAVQKLAGGSSLTGGRQRYSSRRR